MKGQPSDPGPDGMKGDMGLPRLLGKPGVRKFMGAQELLRYISDLKATF